MILSRKHEYSVGNIRCAFAITTGFRFRLKSGSGADSDSKICRQTGFRSEFGVQVFKTGADPESVFCDSAHLW